MTAHECITGGLLVLLLATVSGAEAAVTVDGDFPGGNILLDRIEGDHVYLRQDIRDTKGFWFWWHCRVRGASGTTLTFHFTNGNVLGTRGPAMSLDQGASWTWLGTKTVKGAAFSHAFPDAISAYWIRFRSDTPCTATEQLEYR